MIVERLERASFRQVFLASFVVLFAAHAHTLLDPPYWDALTGAFAQAHWQAQHSFSPFDLLAHAASFNDGGACVYPFSVYPVVVGWFERCGVSVPVTHLALHLVSIAAGAAVLAATFRLARTAVGGGLAALVVLACATLPLFRALVSQMNMEILLAACAVLALLTVGERRWRAVVAWSACALLVKPTGVIVVAAAAVMIALRLRRPAWFGNAEIDRRRAMLALWFLVLLLALFVGQLVIARAHGKSPPGVSVFGGTLLFLAKRLWTLPEFGIVLLLFAAAMPWIVRRVKQRAARELEVDGIVFGAAFVGFYCQYENVLPRYFAVAFPIVLAALVAAAVARIPRRIVGALLVLIAIFGLLNSNGRFHPVKRADWSIPGDTRPLVTNDGWLLERSLEYRDDIELDRALAAEIEARRGNVFVAGWPLLQLLAEPRFGYVTRAPDLAAAETTLEWSARTIELDQRTQDRSRFVRLIVPNVYAGETSRILPGDDVIETFERGRLRAFLVRRPSDSDRSGR